MAELFKFRCYQCQKLIGTTSSKFGRVVHCPRCGVELIVPSPDSEEPLPDDSDSETFRPEDLGLNLEVERLSSPKVASLPSSDSHAPDPIAYLKKASEIGGFPESEFQHEPNPDPDDFQNEPNPVLSSELPEPKAEPILPRKRGSRPAKAYESAPRARDIVMPRTAFVAWAMFALFSLAFAFTAGILIGHYLWK